MWVCGSSGLSPPSPETAALDFARAGIGRDAVRVAVVASQTCTRVYVTRMRIDHLKPLFVVFFYLVIKSLKIQILKYVLLKLFLTRSSEKRGFANNIEFIMLILECIQISHIRCDQLYISNLIKEKKMYLIGAEILDGSARLQNVVPIPFPVLCVRIVYRAGGRGLKI